MVPKQEWRGGIGGSCQDHQQGVAMHLTLKVLVSADTGAAASALTSPLVADAITPVLRKRPIASRAARLVGSVPRLQPRLACALTLTNPVRCRRSRGLSQRQSAHDQPPGHMALLVMQPSQPALLEQALKPEDAERREIFGLLPSRTSCYECLAESTGYGHTSSHLIACMSLRVHSRRRPAAPLSSGSARDL